MAIAMRYRPFGTTGLRVSDLILGTGNFGTGWGYGSSADEAEKIYRLYREVGGNFVDTADQYQFGQSEEIVGRLIESERDEIILATKYSLGSEPESGLQITGNSRKSMVQSVEKSLRRLRTDRIDFLWVHFPDDVTPIDEIARGLEHLSTSGKILYSGLSNFPAWRISAAITLAEARAWHPVSAIQLEYSLVERSAERELLPMARAYGLGVAGWSPLGGGLLTGKYRKGDTGRAQGLGAVIHNEDDSRKTAILDALLAISEKTGVPPGQIAIAWALSRGITPIIGPRTLEQANDNLASLNFQFDGDQLDVLEIASRISLGYPHDLLMQDSIRDRLAGGDRSHMRTDNVRKAR